ncbi:hypothetical protein ACTTAL_05545 [Rhodobacter capsulatus]|uniref:hypothetical protein n=1 Tax=Rhodobacter capsulatus TaxID=1061 RepID=UPI0006865B03|nr:hypothetical protein [Rhodobacter capsulatus]
MPRHQILLVRYPSDEPQQSIERRLTEHLKRLRLAMVLTELDSLWDEDPPRPADPKVDIIIKLEEADRRKIARRAKRLAERREAASGLAHLRKEDRDRLAALRDGVDLIRLPSEHRADEIAAELHAEYPWMAPQRRSSGTRCANRSARVGLVSACRRCCLTARPGSASRLGHVILQPRCACRRS